MQPFLFKMASATSALNRKFLTANEVLQGVFADADSAEEKIESKSETEQSSHEEVHKSDLTPPKLTKIMLVKEVQQQEVIFQELIYIR